MGWLLQRRNHKFGPPWFYAHPKTPFLGIFPKFQKHVFCTIICHQNAKFWGPGTKNDHFRAKNVIFRILGNIDYLRSTNLRKSSYINEYSSFSFYPINAYNSLKWPEEACPDNVWGVICDFCVFEYSRMKTKKHPCSKNTSSSSLKALLHN